MISSAKLFLAIPQPITHRPSLRRLFQQYDFVSGQHLINVQKYIDASFDFGHTRKIILKIYQIILKTAIDIACYLGTNILG
jgi:hypothetical protein